MKLLNKEVKDEHWNEVRKNVNNLSGNAVRFHVWMKIDVIHITWISTGQPIATAIDLKIN